MIYLPQLLTPAKLRVHVACDDEWALLRLLAADMAESQPMAQGVPLDEDTIYEAVAARERARSSGLGHGCALPHARIEGLESPVACFATLSPALDFGAADGEPVQIVCMLLAPLEDPATTLNIMADVAGLMSSASSRIAVESATDAEALHAILQSLESGGDRVLTARNIMRRPLYTVYPDTPLGEVTRLLQAHYLEATSVVDREGQLVGTITCDLLFRYGLPEFFGQLKSVAFVKKFDPFENYFKSLKTGVAADVMTTDYAAVTEDATLLEVIFELSVRRHPKVFVVRDGKLVGIIDRITVLNRVLNY